VFRLALESAPTGSALHAIGDEGVPIREIAEVFASHLDVPAIFVTPELTLAAWSVTNTSGTRPESAQNIRIGSSPIEQLQASCGIRRLGERSP
jgi:hypothetical protein